MLEEAPFVSSDCYSALAHISLPPEPPAVIFLDAVGTLFEVRGSVGEVYGAIAQQFGVTVSASQLNQAFYASFQTSQPAAFPGVSPVEIPQQEYLWWQAIAAQTFQKLGVLEQFQSFEQFFATLYAHFATDAPWFLHPDVVPTLSSWRQLGVELGILSNFDTRLYSVLKALDLLPLFTTITLSTEVGAAKPNPQIFLAALQKHNCLSSAAWHIGDSRREDYEAAKSVGLRGIWLTRDASV
jgi:putative hydrolase of the HAD superfamily